jgi:Domain of unknown function (DUF4190)
MLMNEPLASPPPPPTGPPVSSAASTQAITALVLGILGVLCCHPLAPVAWYLGLNEARAIRAGRAPVAGEGFAMAGKILGIIGTVILVLGLLFGLLWMLLFGGMAVLQGLSNR